MKCLALAFVVFGTVGCGESGDGRPPCICPTIHAPVCGVDGITYGNSCLAQCEDVEIAYEGACDECQGDGDCEPDEICIDWPPEEAAECIWVGCDRDDQCRPGEVCVIDDICRAPADVGPCDAVFPRWFYNSDTGECEEFIWGGCGGNANNFETKEECEAMCPSFASKLTIAPRAGHCDVQSRILRRDTNNPTRIPTTVNKAGRPLMH